MLDDWNPIIAKVKMGQPRKDTLLQRYYPLDIIAI